MHWQQRRAGGEKRWGRHACDINRLVFNSSVVTRPALLFFSFAVIDFIISRVFFQTDPPPTHKPPLQRTHKLMNKKFTNDCLLCGVFQTLARVQKNENQSKNKQQGNQNTKHESNAI